MGAQGGALPQSPSSLGKKGERGGGEKGEREIPPQKVDRVKTVSSIKAAKDREAFFSCRQEVQPPRCGRGVDHLPD